jgi:hypothetical protein
MSDTAVIDPTTTETPTANTAVAEAATQTVAVGKATKHAKSGDIIADIAVEVESLSKVKALNEADRLATTVEISYLRLGGVLKLINDNSWFDGYPDFGTFVEEKYGFAIRKAKYLIDIYTHLVTKMIPWEKVQHLGWTKLKDLAPVLTLENLDEWVAKATPLTVKELQAILKPASAEGEKANATTSDTVKITYNFKADQYDVVAKATAKAKAELGTEFDTVAVENIMSGYLGGNTAVAYSLDDVIKSAGFNAVMERVGELFPEFDISVGPAAGTEVTNLEGLDSGPDATELATA